MRRYAKWLTLSWLVLLASAIAARAQDVPSYKRTRDVIYGRKAGLALTLDVFVPRKNLNHTAVIYVISGGWFSRPENIDPLYCHELLRRGYTVFAVVHGSQPEFTIPDILEDMHRAVRYIRFNAARYHIDPDRLGILGASAGGHLALMQGTAGLPANPNAPDKIDRCSSRVQAVACFFPPTDFLNFGQPGKELTAQTWQPPFSAAIDFKEYDPSRGRYLPVTDSARVREILRRISPITHVSADDPPTLIIHGEKDTLVPLQQSQSMVARLKVAGVPTRLIIKEGAGHGWRDMPSDLGTCADWFDKYIAKPAPAKTSGKN